MIFLGKIVSYLVYLGQSEDFKLTTELSEKVQYNTPTTGNQKRIKWRNTVYLNKRSFMFKIKFCVFQVAKT